SSTARFNCPPTFGSPIGITVSPNGTLFVTESNHTIRQVTPDGTVSILCGSPGERGFIDGKTSAARFCYPTGIAVSPNGTLYVTEIFNHTIRQVTPDVTVSALCGSSGLRGEHGSTDGKGSAARFYHPTEIAASPNGTLFVADHSNHTIRQVTTDGT